MSGLAGSRWAKVSEKAELHEKNQEPVDDEKLKVGLGASKWSKAESASETVAEKASVEKPLTNKPAIEKLAKDEPPKPSKTEELIKSPKKHPRSKYDSNAGNGGMWPRDLNNDVQSSHHRTKGQTDPSSPNKKMVNRGNLEENNGKHRSHGENRLPKSANTAKSSRHRRKSSFNDNNKTKAKEATKVKSEPQPVERHEPVDMAALQAELDALGEGDESNWADYESE